MPTVEKKTQQTAGVITALEVQDRSYRALYERDSNHVYHNIPELVEGLKKAKDQIM